MQTIQDRVGALPPEARSYYEGIAEAFEDSWGSATEPPEIASVLPEGEPLRTLVLIQLVKCDLESRLKGDPSVWVERYFSRFPELVKDRAAQVELIHWEYQLRTPDESVREDYLRRFPDLAEHLRPLLAPEAPPAVPSLPGYSDVRELARGGMGVVYLAWHDAQKREEVLKLIDPRLAGDPKALDRFRAEATCAGRVDNPNIVKVYSSGQSDGLYYFAMEYCRGGSLKDRLIRKRGPLIPREAAELLVPIAWAVHAVHTALEEGPIIHRDLKPANVLFLADGTPKIADFGLARRPEEPGRTSTGAALGTPAYMAPEQVRGAGQLLGPATDVYGLGAILYETLTGRPPFLAPSVFEVYEQVRDNAPESPRALQPKVPRDLEIICLKCLQKKPAERYASAQELADDLRRFLDGAAIHARRVGELVRAWKWARRRPAVAGLLLAVAVTLLVGIAVSTYFAVEANQQAEQARQKAKDATEARDQADSSLKQLNAQFDVLENKAGELVSVAMIKQLVESWESLVREFPERGNARNQLASSYHSLGAWYRAAGQSAKQEEAWKKSAAVSEKLVSEFPMDFGYADYLGRTYYNLGVMAEKQDKPREAVDWQTKAIDTLENLPRPLTPQDPGAWFLWSACHVRAKMLTRLGGRDNHEKALRDWNRALELAPEENRKTLLLNRGYARAHFGDHAEAVAEAEALVMGAPTDADLMYDAACLCALSAAAASRDDRLSLAQRTETAERYAAEAVGWLEKAHSAGYFATPENLSKLSKDPDPDLDALRKRDDFQKVARAIHSRPAGPTR